MYRPCCLSSSIFSFFYLFLASFSSLIRFSSASLASSIARSLSSSSFYSRSNSACSFSRYAFYAIIFWAIAAPPPCFLPAAGFFSGAFFYSSGAAVYTSPLALAAASFSAFILALSFFICAYERPA